MSFGGGGIWNSFVSAENSGMNTSDGVWQPLGNFGPIVGNDNVLSLEKQLSDKQRRHLERLEQARLAKLEKKQANLAKQEEIIREKQKKREDALAKIKSEMERKEEKKRLVEEQLILSHKKKLERKRHSSSLLLAEQKSKKQRLSLLAKQYIEKLEQDITAYYEQLDDKTKVLVKNRLSDLDVTPGDFTLGSTDVMFSSGCLIPMPSDQPWGHREKNPAERINFNENVLKNLMNGDYRVSNIVATPTPINFDIGKVEAKNVLHIPNASLPSNVADRARMLSRISPEGSEMGATRLGTFLVNRILALPAKMREDTWMKAEQLIDDTEKRLLDIEKPNSTPIKS